MIAEGIKQIQALADKAAPIQVVREFPSELWVRAPEGNIEQHSKPIAARNYVADSQADFIAQVLHLHGRVTPSGMPSEAGVVMFAGGAMVAVLNECGMRNQRVTHGMQYSSAFRALKDLDSTYLTQGDMHRIMRTSLAGIAPTEFTTFLSNIKLSRSVESEGQIAVGSESIRRDVKASMAGAGFVPDRVKFSTNVYLDHDGDVENIEPFEFALEIDYANAKLALLPLADCLAKARRRTDIRVRDELDKALRPIGVRAFLGSFE